MPKSQLPPKDDEYDKMIAGKPYNPTTEYLTALRIKCHSLCDKYNRTVESNYDGRKQLIPEIVGSHKSTYYFEKSIKFDYGCNIHIGENFYANFDLTILDIAPVTFGDNVFLGPGVNIFTVNHPLNYKIRATAIEKGKEVKIGNNVWIGGRVVICPGVTIGDGCVIGAGAIVTKSFGNNCLIAGNPAKVIKKIDQDYNDFADCKM